MKGRPRSPLVNLRAPSGFSPRPLGQRPPQEASRSWALSGERGSGLGAGPPCPGTEVVAPRSGDVGDQSDATLYVVTAQGAGVQL